VGSYYYLVSQLPTLSWGAQAPMSSGHFRSLCATLMNAGDFALLDACVLEPKPGKSTGSSLIDSWLGWERSLRLNLAQNRSQRLKRDSAALPDAPSDPLDALTLSKLVMSLDSPLEAEKTLDLARWAAIERFQGFDYFGRDTLYAYLLKLLMLERKALFRVEEGFMEYKKIYASVMEAAPNNMQAGEPK